MTNYHNGNAVRVIILSRVTGSKLGELHNPSVEAVEEWSKLFDMVVECVYCDEYAREAV